MVHCLVHLEKGMWLGLLPEQQKKKGSQLLGADIRLLQQKTTSDDGLPETIAEALHLVSHLITKPSHRSPIANHWSSPSGTCIILNIELIQGILKYPPTRTLTGDERQLLWKFRFSLMSEKRALTKFLRCVEWSDIQEAKQAIDLMGRWESIDVTDALELLSPVFESEEVRAYAVSVLERADDEELKCYLLQLVQALRFERTDKSRLAQFLVQRSLSNIELASFLRWYVAVELHDPAYAKRYYCTYDMLEDNMMKLQVGISREENGYKLWQSLVRQTDLIAQLCSITKDVRNVRGGTQKKIEKLRHLLTGLLSELTYFDEPIRSPLAPGTLITGIVPAESSIFKSALHPLRLTFRTLSGETCKVIQMVSLMDRLLKLENLDLQLTPYKVLATGQDEGMLEFVPSSSLAQILSEDRSIVSYLQRFHPDEDGPFGITAQCLETFIKSCAGYSVITYILGIGDRRMGWKREREKWKNTNGRGE
ncbi:hypothetical protein ZIOFF_068867 [Zingiber officinale]|uniref:phosphatidylinositol 3-kinase n=1 Tax=Zingiber officinale TaxID=94328 RepID=A0A8J5ETZ4_ZINOF|nr:hypothetical protein ZIOFF_068867 [Zingiber officinale]